jgi:hypothetical protein
MAYYNKIDKAINPKFILRFDCRQINEIKVLRLTPIKEIIKEKDQ